MTLPEVLAAIDAAYDCKTLADFAARLGVDRRTASNTKAFMKRRGCKLPNYPTGSKRPPSPEMSADDWAAAVRYSRDKAEAAALQRSKDAGEAEARRYRERLVG